MTTETLSRARGGARPRTSALFAGVGALLALVSVQGQEGLVDCEGHVRGRYSIYMNELSFVKPELEEDAELKSFNHQIQFGMQNKRESLLLSHPKPVLLLHCPDRRPKNNSVYLEREFVRSLELDRVILEVWGQLDADTAGGAIKNRRVTIYFVLIPILGEDDSQTRKAAIQRVDYSKERPEDDLVETVSQAGELEGFAAVGVGIWFLKNEEYGRAVSAFQTALGRLDSRNPSEARAALIEYIRKRGKEAAEKIGLEELFS